MAVFHPTTAVPFGAISVHKIVSFADRMVAAVRAKFVAERTLSQLSRLTPAQLRDIGLADHDLISVSYQMSRRNR